MGATKTADPSFNDDEQDIYRVILFKADVDYEVARHRADPPICGLPCRLGLCVKTEEYPEVHDKPSKSNSVYEHGAASISATSRTAHLQFESLGNLRSTDCVFARRFQTKLTTTCLCQRSARARHT